MKHAGVSLQEGFQGVICFLQDDQTPSAEQPAAFARDHLHLTPVAVRDQSANLVCDFGCDNKFHWVSVQTKSMYQGNHSMTKPARLLLLQRRWLSLESPVHSTTTQYICRYPQLTIHLEPELKSQRRQGTSLTRFISQDLKREI